MFAGLDDARLLEISRRLAPVRFEKGSFIFYRNDLSDGIYFVAKGSIQIIIDNDENREIIVYTVPAGDILGELSLFENRLRSATAVALEECRLYKIPGDKFQEIIKQYPAVGENLAKVLINRLLAANEMIERLGAMDGTGRVVDFLRAAAQREGRRLEDGYLLEKRPTYNQVSHRLGVSEKTVYRTIHKLIEEGKIAMKGRGLLVNKSLFIG